MTFTASHPSPGSHRRPSVAKDGLPSNTTTSHLPEQLAPLISKLREQHGALSELLQSMSPVHAHHRSHLPQTIDEEGTSTPTTKNAPSWQSYRSSMSTVTDNGSVFYDAMDAEEFGAEEYIVPEEQMDEEEEFGAKGSTSMDTMSTSITEDEEEDNGHVKTEDDTPDEKPSLPVDRRTHLPARPPGDEGSLFTVLKKNVGQVCKNRASVY